MALTFEFSTLNLREQIAIVPQDPVLFDDSIMENIRLGMQSATDEEVVQPPCKPSLTTL